MTTKTKLLASLAMAGFAATLVGPAWAQEAADEQAAADTDTNEGDIIVSARRREERILDVPVAVTAIAGDSLAKQQIARTEDLQIKTPGLSIQNTAYGPTLPRIAIRGQQQILQNVTVDQSVAVYLNDVVLARPSGVNSSLYDLESVQVLKGPQGTLFGRNSTGGAILFSTKAPTDRFEGYVQGTLGNYDARAIEGAINIPIVEGVKLRAAGRRSKRDGFTYNLLTDEHINNENSTDWRVSLRVDPGSDFRSDLMITGSRDKIRGTPYKIAFTYAGANGPASKPFLDDLRTRPFQTVNTSATPAYVRTLTLTHRLEWEPSDAITVRNIFGYRHVRSSQAGDFDGTPLPLKLNIERMDVDQFSEELQVLGSSDRLDWIVGAYVFDEDAYEEREQPTGATKLLDRGYVRNRAYAAYAQATYRLLDNVSATAGVRYTRDERRVTTANLINGNCRLVVSNTSTVVLDPCRRTAQTNNSEPTYTFAVDWKPNSDTLVYATTRRGYRTGGISFANAVRPADLDPFRPETVTDYEVGFKASMRPGGIPVNFNVAAYKADYKDLQKTIIRIITAGGSTFTSSAIANAASATAKGLEADLTVRPASWLELSGFYAYIDQKYDGFVTPDGIDRSNNAFAGIPRHSGGGSVQFTLPVGEDAGDLTIRGDVYYTAASYAQEINTDPVSGLRFDGQRLPSYTLVNVRADWRDILGSGFRAAAFARNLFDKEYFVGAVDLTAAIGMTSKVPAPPRTYGIEVGYEF